MTSRATRSDRLRAVLPRVFRTQPAETALGQLLDALGLALEQLDDDMAAVLRDRWVRTARGEPLGARVTSPLELLGRSVGIARERWESTEAYRRRLRLMVPIVTRRDTSPRAVLAMATAALDMDLCPRLEHEGDTTTGWGLRPNSLRHCPARPCSGAGSCPMAAARQVEVHVTDSPPTAVRWGPRKIPDEGRFTLDSRSLARDRPTVSISVPMDAPEVFNPSLHCIETHEQVVFVGSIRPGETLTILPGVDAAEASRFDSPVGADHHPWLAHHPRGRAELGDRGDRTDRVVFVAGHAFDEARFAGPDDAKPVFADGDASCSTPCVPVGSSTWRFRSLRADEVQTLLDDEESARLDPRNPPDPNAARTVEIALGWWARPRATFLVTIPRTAGLRRAIARGDGPGDTHVALDLLAESVQRARAIGIRARLDLPLPALAEEHAVTDSLTLDGTSTLAALLRAFDAVRASASEPAVETHTVTTGFAFGGTFEVTRFDESHFTEEPP